MTPDTSRRSSSDSKRQRTAQTSFRDRFSTSGFLTPALIGMLCVGLLVATFERGRGHYQRLRSRVGADDPVAGGPPGPGGQPALTLRRPASTTQQPEFLSATLLPGRGMNILQITATVPGHGELPLLFGPSEASVQQVLTATGPDAYGALSSTFGGAIAAPWAGQLAGVATANRSILQGVWQGQRLTYPAAAEGSSVSTEGLLLNRGADALETSSIPGGKAVQAVFHAGTFGGSWPSSTEISVQVELTAHDVELAIVVKNIGQAPVPAGIGWHPYFALPEGQRSTALLSVPASLRIAHEDRFGLPTGAATPVTGTPFDFNSSRGVPLRGANLHATYLHLQHGILADGPVVELRNPAQGYALRLTPLTETIRFLHVVAPADRPWISLQPVTNLDDALRQDTAPRAAQLTSAQDERTLDTLQPGDSLHWRVRLEIVPLS